MQNLDTRLEEGTGMMQRMADALAAGDAAGAAEAFMEFQDATARRIEEEFGRFRDTADMAALQGSGLRALTSEEAGFYQKLIGAARAPSPRQAIADIGEAMPPTIIDRVLDDMKKSHPLLGALRIQNAAGALKVVSNAAQMASKFGSWGQVTSAITAQLSGQIRTVDLTAAKYTAYFTIPKDFTRFNFSFAPAWVDRYIREILSEAVANGLEKAAVSGNGKNMPAGMVMDTGTATDGAYSEKEPVPLADWDRSYRETVAGLCKDQNGDYRDVPEVLLVVNPKDDITRLRGIRNAITPAGMVDLISHSYPTKTVTSAFMPEGRAAVGIAGNYFLAVNGGQSGIIEYSDEYQFLEDARIYTTRVYGMGMPLDNNSFAYLDITATAEPAFPVRAAGTVALPVGGGE